MTQQSAVEAVRRSHENLTTLISALGADEFTRPSRASDWSVAQVASHLGSQAEIFDLFLDAGADGSRAPGGGDFKKIWSRWDAMGPAEQVSSSTAANARLVDRLEELERADDDFSIDMFGGRRDVENIAALRLGEHALHSWDIAAALDPTATVGADSVPIVLDGLPGIAARSGQPSGVRDAGDEGEAVEAVEAGDADATSVVIHVTKPERAYRLTTAPKVGLEPETGGAGADLVMPAEALIRLVYGRLDEDHTPEGVVGAEHLRGLRAVFPGF